MNATESKVLMDKLQGLMKAAEEFGNQSTQLAKSRGDFDAYLAGVNETNERMVALVTRCNEYLDAAHELVHQDLFAGVSDLVADCKAHCELVTSQYEEVLAKFEAQKQLFDDTQTALVATVEKEIRTVDEDFKASADKLAGIEADILATQERIKADVATLPVRIEMQQQAMKTAFLEKMVEVDEHQLATKSDLLKILTDLCSTIQTNQNAIMASVEGVSKHLDEQRLATKAELLEKMSGFGNDLQSIRESQDKANLYLKVGAVAAAVAAIAAIIGLFL